MGILDRFGNLIKSYISNDEDRVFGRSASRGRSDPDLDAAYEEIDEFLHRGTSSQAGLGGEARGKQRPIPEDIRRDFAELGLAPDTTPEKCKETYKKLQKIHHPDRHSNHPGNMEKATDKTARINAAYERLTTWFRLQNPP